jgi:hypothetical protein
MLPLTLTLTPSAADYRRILKIHMRRSLLRLRGLSIFFFLCGLFSPLVGAQVLVVSVGCFALSFLMPSLGVRKLPASSFTERQYEISAEGLQITSVTATKRTTVDCSWAAFHSAMPVTEFWIIRGEEKEFPTILPRRGVSPEQDQALTALLTERGLWRPQR